ncbi:hypothetical protein CTEN210_09081 [Chaetoceros tenuissimus]|uniref:MYND-type domain-containing protein n=1 Tax=Chaetoceros tenuissimus TaxID=426638 RepID=A0AAD3CX50_9STRA|nr:hypothetical protein CTEN210_09081 [Chaetoceros tenuissimus]
MSPQYNLTRRQQQIVELFNATSDGEPSYLDFLIRVGKCPWDEPCPYAGTKTIPINLAAQYQRHDNMAILAQKALETNQPHLLEATDARNRTPAYLAVQKGNPECLGVMAKAGANLHKACPHVWENQVIPGNHLFDPDPDDPTYKVHTALNETVMSFTNETCCECFEGKKKLLTCSRCEMARFCNADCQKKNWGRHKLVCKRIAKGAKLVTFHDRIPDPKPIDDDCFVDFFPSDDVIEDLDSDEEEEIQEYIWEYYDVKSKEWKVYPKKVNYSLERLYDTYQTEPTCTRCMYKPGDEDAYGLEERKLSANPPDNVATHHAYFTHMIDHQIYTGAGRRMRRRKL